jgi:putative acetyltransferase
VVEIREQRASDADGIRQVLTAAYGREAEARLVERLRATGKAKPSLVAEVGARLLGHVLFSPIGIETTGNMVTVSALAPLAVLPAFQRLGIGSALVSAGLGRLKTSAAAVLVIGEPQYYGRFGFVPASRFGIRSPFPTPDENFMALELVPNGLKNCSGLARYGHEFDDLE